MTYSEYVRLILCYFQTLSQFPLKKLSGGYCQNYYLEVICLSLGRTLRPDNLHIYRLELHQIHLTFSLEAHRTTLTFITAFVSKFVAKFAY